MSPSSASGSNPWLLKHALALLKLGPASLTFNHPDGWPEPAARQVKLARRAGGILHTLGLHDRVAAVGAATILGRLAELLHFLTSKPLWSRSRVALPL
jgi:hypothetical protein